MIKIVSIFFILLFCSINVFSQKKYTLAECYLLALDRNLTLKQAQNQVTINYIDHKTAVFSLLPSVSYTLGHNYSVGKNIDPVTNFFVNETFSGGFTGVGLQMQIFSGFNKLNTIKQSSYLVKSAEAAKKKTELDILSNVTLTYSRLLANREQALIEINNIESTKKQLEVINEKIKVGRMTRFEAYAFEARLNTEQANLITIQNDASIALQDLKHLLNIKYKDPVDISPIDNATISEIYSNNIYLTDFIDTILLNHPAIKQARLEQQVAESGLGIAKSYSYPSLSVGGNISSNYNVNRTNSVGTKIPIGRQLTQNEGKNLNISLRIPIFSQMQNIGFVKKAKIDINTAQLNLQEAENIIVKNTLQLINDFNSSRQKYLATLSARDQNVLSYSMYEEKYKLGQLSSLELLTARNLLNTANSHHLQAKLELFFNYQLLLLLKR